MRFSHLIPLLISVLLASVMATKTARSTLISMFIYTENAVKTGGSLIAILFIVVNLVVCSASYRLFRDALFVHDVVGGGVFFAVIVEHAFKDKSWMIAASWIGYALGSLISGFIVNSLYAWRPVLIVVMVASLFGAGAQLIVWDSDDLKP